MSDALETTTRAPISNVAPERDAWNLLQSQAKAFSESQLVPAHMRGKVADCIVAMVMARELGDNPLVVMQNIYIVSGRAGWSTQYMIARANRSGVIKGRITWETAGMGDKLVVTARATLADTGEVITATASMEMAKLEGWLKNDKYRSMPEHMLKWRAATMLIRLYMPEVMLGYSTAEELEVLPRDAGNIIDVEATPARPTGAAEAVRARLTQQAPPIEVQPTPERERVPVPVASTENPDDV